MNKKNKTINAIIYNGDQSGYVCICHGFPVITQGATPEDVLGNFKEAIELHLDDINPDKRDYVDNPSIVFRFEIDVLYPVIINKVEDKQGECHDTFSETGS